MNTSRSIIPRPRAERIVAGSLAILVALAVPGAPLSPAPARAEGEGFKTIITNTGYGLACGLVLGGVLTLVVDSDDRSEVLRWGVVIGTFSGFGYGVYAATRDSGLFSAIPHRNGDDLLAMAVPWDARTTEAPGAGPSSSAPPAIYRVTNWEQAWYQAPDLQPTRRTTW